MSGRRKRPLSAKRAKSVAPIPEGSVIAKTPAPPPDDAVWIRLPVPPDVVAKARKHVDVIAALAGEVRALEGGVPELGALLGRIVRAATDLEADVMDVRRRRRRRARD